MVSHLFISNQDAHFTTSFKHHQSNRITSIFSENAQIFLSTIRTRYVNIFFNSILCEIIIIINENYSFSFFIYIITNGNIKLNIDIYDNPWGCEW